MSKNNHPNELVFPRNTNQRGHKTKTVGNSENQKPAEIKATPISVEEPIPISSVNNEHNVNESNESFVPDEAFKLPKFTPENPIIIEESVHKVTTAIASNKTMLQTLACLIAEELTNKLDVSQQLNFIKKFSTNEIDSAKFEVQQELIGFADVLGKMFSISLNNLVHSISNQSKRSN